MAIELGETSWKAFTKKQKLEAELDDKDLLKALAKFDKSDESKPGPRLEALGDLAKEIARQATALAKLKKKLGDKPYGLVKDQLDAMLQGAEALQKKTLAALDGDGDEDEDSAPDALVNPKLLLRQLNMCRKDPERKMNFAFVDGKGNDQPPMLALHPRKGARALFAKLQDATEVKTGAYGSAWVDGMTLMLQLDKPLSGLVKKVRHPVRACGFRITKAVLCNADGTVFEQDELPDEAAGEGMVPANAMADSADDFEARYADLLPTVTADALALRKRDATGAAPVQKLIDSAAVQARARDFQQAYGELDKATQAIASAAGAARAKDAAQVIPAGTVAAKKAALEAAQARWERGLQSALKEVKPAKDVLKGSYAASAVGIDGILDSYQRELTGLLDAARQAKEADVPTRIRAALQGVDSLGQEMDRDDLLTYLARCGLPVRRSFKDALAEIRTLLQP